ncbi:hypothetical protein KTJ34_01620 [Acinetobacter courvalinii]|uniref:hypothetical protein n=1 Tax=Acinetobacter courvalinii TaxID=280147 RepID=UPI0021CF3F2D|nr:hypothetical protein [Acinetobacter courvalinii]MCU4576110.1 hypothetical protein [Acinetobacter courvalinii]
MIGSMDQSHIAAFERFIAVIKAVGTLPVATSKEIRKAAIPNLSNRQTQVYLKNLFDRGYIRFIGNPHTEHRYFLTEQSMQLFNVTKRDVEQNISTELEDNLSLDQRVKDCA